MSPSTGPNSWGARGAPRPPRASQALLAAIGADTERRKPALDEWLESTLTTEGSTLDARHGAGDTTAERLDAAATDLRARHRRLEATTADETAQQSVAVADATASSTTNLAIKLGAPSVSRRQAGGRLCVSPRGRIERLERDGAREVRPADLSSQSLVSQS